MEVYSIDDGGGRGGYGASGGRQCETQCDAE